MPQLATLRRAGRYLLYRDIGTGGMATVSLAKLQGESGFSRVVAIKKLLPHLAADEQLVASLLDEARLVALIKHPNVVPVLDVVRVEGELLLVMEYIHGDSLAGLLQVAAGRGEKVHPTIAASIALGVLEGLHAAHEATDASGVSLQLVHRDISPQNVLVGVDGVARVSDFGIAKAFGRLQQTTEHGIAKGKLPYMAPEHFAGKAVDRRTDVWAASVVLWEMLATERLFADQSAVFRFHASSERVRPLASELDIPDALRTVVERGLARDPEERYQSAREMIVELEKAISPAPVRRVGQWVKRLARSKLEARAVDVQELESANAPAIAPAASEPTPVVSPHRPDGERSRPRARSRSRVALLLTIFCGVSLSAVVGARALRAPVATSAPAATGSPSLTLTGRNIGEVRTAVPVSAPSASAAPSVTARAHKPGSRPANPEGATRSSPHQKPDGGTVSSDDGLELDSRQ